MIYFVDIICYP